ncbi:hypothetical protein F5I97DRAFT_1929993 [Phlebopus sp. FC_14]|nr:hypothetical protein F5I97DRAFT_1929993 [Phlebopus sp. FC_14]
MASPEPPYYILVSYASLQQGSSMQSSSALAHADVEYHYIDDSPLSLLPRHPDEHVLVLNHDPHSVTGPTVKSTSSQLAVSGIKILAAPGAGADEDRPNRNEDMYVLEVTSTSDDQYANSLIALKYNLNRRCLSASVESSQASLQNPQAIVAHFKQRNAAIRRVLDHAGIPVDQSRPNSQAKSPDHN